nr:hypothetical protein Iba_chr09bCG5790 [Ipomoea batatas]
MELPDIVSHQETLTQVLMKEKRWAQTNLACNKLNDLLLREFTARSSYHICHRVLSGLDVERIAPTLSTARHITGINKRNPGFSPGNVGELRQHKGGCVKEVDARLKNVDHGLGSHHFNLQRLPFHGDGGFPWVQWTLTRGILRERESNLLLLSSSSLLLEVPGLWSNLLNHLHCSSSDHRAWIFSLGPTREARDPLISLACKQMEGPVAPLDSEEPCIEQQPAI